MADTVAGRNGDVHDILGEHGAEIGAIYSRQVRLEMQGLQHQGETRTALKALADDIESIRSMMIEVRTNIGLLVEDRLTKGRQ